MAAATCLLLAACGSATSPSASSGTSAPSTVPSTATPTVVPGDSARPLPALTVATEGPALPACDPSAVRYGVLTDHTAYALGQTVNAVEVASTTAAPCALAPVCYPSMHVADAGGRILNVHITNYLCVKRPPFTISAADIAIDALTWSQAAACAPRSPDPVCAGGQVPPGTYRITTPQPSATAEFTIG